MGPKISLLCLFPVLSCSTMFCWCRAINVCCRHVDVLISMEVAEDHIKIASVLERDNEGIRDSNCVGWCLCVCERERERERERKSMRDGVSM